MLPLYWMIFGGSLVFVLGMLAGSLLTLPSAFRPLKPAPLPKDWQPSEQDLTTTAENLVGTACARCCNPWLFCDCDTPPPEPTKLPLYRYDDDGIPYLPKDGGAV